MRTAGVKKTARLAPARGKKFGRTIQGKSTPHSLIAVERCNMARAYITAPEA